MDHLHNGLQIHGIIHNRSYHTFSHTTYEPNVVCTYGLVAVYWRNCITSKRCFVRSFRKWRPRPASRRGRPTAIFAHCHPRRTPTSHPRVPLGLPARSPAPSSSQMSLLWQRRRRWRQCLLIIAIDASDGVIASEGGPRATMLPSGHGTVRGGPWTRSVEPTPRRKTGKDREGEERVGRKRRRR